MPAAVAQFRHSMYHVIFGAISGAIFGRRDAVVSRASRAGTSIDDVHALSQRFALAAPMGGGAMLAVQAWNAQAILDSSYID